MGFERSDSGFLLGPDRFDGGRAQGHENEYGRWQLEGGAKGGEVRDHIHASGRRLHQPLTTSPGVRCARVRVVQVRCSCGRTGLMWRAEGRTVHVTCASMCARWCTVASRGLGRVSGLNVQSSLECEKKKKKK